MPKVIGIDLGTTNSCVAVLEGGEPVVIPNAEGARTTPSIVAITKSGERLVGEVAKRQAITNPENTVFSIKRFMGRKYDDPEVDRDRRMVPYKVVRSSNGDAWVEIQGKAYSPPEVSAMILQKLKADAEAYLGERVTEAVITVPAYFNDAQRQATRDAGRIAGLDVKRILSESVAASLAYGFHRMKDERIVIYDLGGGVFNVSIMELGDGVFEVKSTNGDTHLGGDDFDQRIITWLADEFKEEQGIDLRQDRMALQRLKEAAEKAKKELSSSLQTEVNLPFITADAKGPKHLTINFPRAKLEQLVEDLIEKSRVPMTKALSDAGMRPGDVNEVVLVGGQTRMPAVQLMVKRIFDREPNRGVNPDEVVAIGAAIQAGVLTGDVKDVLLLDVTPLSLGIEVVNVCSLPLSVKEISPKTTCVRLIERNTTIPTQRSMIFSTESDNQPSVEINVLQGEREFAKDNRSLGTFILDGIPPAPRGVPQIEVTFDLDANGIITVLAHDKGTGREQKITIVASSGLSKDQIDRMVRDAESHAAEDRRRKEEVEERNLADSAAYRAEKSMSEQDDKITTEQTRELKSRIADVRVALNGDDLSHIQSARESLEQAFYKISEFIYQQTSSYKSPPAPDEKGAAQASNRNQNKEAHEPDKQPPRYVGNYRILQQIGQGGFAEVYLAEHRYLKTLAAIKQLHTHMERRNIDTFMQEAQMIARLRHPHIIRVLDFGVEQNQPFLIMDYAPKGTLRDIYPRGQSLPPDKVLPYIKQIASALQYAHDNQIVHRDVKPENMLIEDDEKVALSDFGIAIPTHNTATMQTQDMIGTIAYMAPEQIQGKARPASDQYALATALYEWLCGRLPFEEGPWFAVIYSKQNDIPPRPREIVPSLSPLIEEVLLKALSKDYHQRFATIRAFAHAFEQACRG